jgi:hypothetical protein
MKQLIALTKRNLLEILRDPLAAVFCIAFPVVMLTFMQAIFSGFEFVPENFQIENYSMGICVFGYAFAGMFPAASTVCPIPNPGYQRLSGQSTGTGHGFLSACHPRGGLRRSHR